MMKHIKWSMLLLLLSAVFVACDNDDPSSKSIFENETKTESEFDKWINSNFVEPYNIRLNYLYNDKLTNNSYNVVPATIANSKVMAQMIKHVWLDAYVEACGADFVKSNAFRVFQFIGSPEYNGQGEIVLGTAEGGIQVTLFRINELDPENLFVNQDDAFRDHGALPLDLNYWYFHTMHHEFCHILTQKKYYSTDFQTISAGKYHSADWINVDDVDAPQEGFITGYATSEYNEDFAEVYATYVTSSDQSWTTRLDEGKEYTYEGTDANGNLMSASFWGKPSNSELVGAGFKKLTKASITSTAGYDKIISKLEIVRNYFSETWGIDLENLRSIVLRRSAEVQDMDFSTLK